MGKADEQVGDTLEAPGSRLEYDFLAFDEAAPAGVRTQHRARVHHVTETDVAAAGARRDDRVGRVLRRLRTAAADPDAGRGRAVRRPCVRRRRTAGGPGRAGGRRDRPSSGARRARRTWSSAAGRSTTTRAASSRSTSRSSPPASTMRRPATRSSGRRRPMFYDPRGQLIRTLNPDGSEQRVVYGVPADARRPRAVRADAVGGLHLRRQRQRRAVRPTARRSPKRAGSASLTRPPASWSTRSAAPCEAVARNGADPRRTGSQHPLELRHPRQSAHADRRAAAALPSATATTSPTDPGGSKASMPACAARCSTPLGNAIERRDGKGALALQRLRSPAPADPAVGARRAGRPAHAAPAPGIRRRRSAGAARAERAGDARRKPARPAPSPLRRSRARHGGDGRLQGQSARQRRAGSSPTRRSSPCSSRRRPTRWQVTPFQVDWQPAAAANAWPSATPSCSSRRPIERPPASTR